MFTFFPGSVNSSKRLDLDHKISGNFFNYKSCSQPDLNRTWTEVKRSKTFHPPRSNNQSFHRNFVHQECIQLNNKLIYRRFTKISRHQHWKCYISISYQKHTRFAENTHSLNFTVIIMDEELSYERRIGKCFEITAGIMVASFTAPPTVFVAR